MKSIKHFGISLMVVASVLFIPVVTFAQARTPTGYCSDVSLSGGVNLSGSTIGGVIKYITCLITQSIVPLIFAVASVVFFWGVVKFIQSGDSTEQREQGRQFMLWGVIALTVMISVWGLVRILGNTFQVGNVLPALPVDKSIK